MKVNIITACKKCGLQIEGLSVRQAYSHGFTCDDCKNVDRVAQQITTYFTNLKK